MMPSHITNKRHTTSNKMLPPKLDPCLTAINWMLDEPVHTLVLHSIHFVHILCIDVAFDRKSAGKFVRITEMNDNAKLVCTSKGGSFNPLLDMILDFDTPLARKKLNDHMVTLSISPDNFGL